MVTIRKAVEADRPAVANSIITAFDNDFSAFIKQFGREFVLNFMEQVLQMKYFYVAEQADHIIGILAISDANGRATKLDRQQLTKSFGRFKTFLLGLGFSDFEKPKAGFSIIHQKEETFSQSSKRFQRIYLDGTISRLILS